FSMILMSVAASAQTFTPVFPDAHGLSAHPCPYGPTPAALLCLGDAVVIDGGGNNLYGQQAGGLYRVDPSGSQVPISSGGYLGPHGGGTDGSVVMEPGTGKILVSHIQNGVVRVDPATGFQ